MVSVATPTVDPAYAPSAVAEPFVCSPDVAGAISSGRPVVALESTILTHGPPRPANLEIGRELEALVRSGGAVPATVAVLDGVACVGLDASPLERVALDLDLRKVSQRDLPKVVAAGASGGTTVSATAAVAARAGVRVFATGGLGGAHRGWHDSGMSPPISSPWGPPGSPSGPPA